MSKKKIYNSKGKKIDLSEFISNLPECDLESKILRAKQEAQTQPIVGMPMAGCSGDKIILVVGIPRGREKTLEFSIDDIVRIDELPDAVRPVTREVVKQVRVWVKDGAPFLLYAHGTIDKRRGEKDDIFINRVFGPARRDAVGSLKFFSCPCVDCNCETSCTDCRESCLGNCECDDDFQTSAQAFGFRSLENSGNTFLGNTTLGNNLKNLTAADFFF